MPYPVFAVSGMVIWLFFSRRSRERPTARWRARTLISKVYFPRMVIPVAAVLPPTMDFVIAFVVVAGRDAASTA